MSAQVECVFNNRQHHRGHPARLRRQPVLSFNGEGVRAIQPRGLSFHLLFCAALLAPTLLAAQARPAGSPDVWVELGLGASRMDPNCDACNQRGRIAGPSAQVVAGITLTPDFGIAVLGRTFSEFSFDISHSASYWVALAQYSPAGEHELTFNLGLGSGNQVGDPPPNGDSGSGAVIAGGMALRLPSSTLFGFTLTADVMKTVTGSLRAAPGQATSAYRPTLVTIGLGVNIAGSAK